MALAALCIVLGVNGLVRLTGGDPHWLSVRYLPEKSGALLRLGMHLAGHWAAAPEDALENVVAQAARRQRVPMRLAIAVARAESGFDPHAISRTGAMGLMQLMPETAQALGVRDPFDPAQNADGATRLLRQLLRRYRGDPWRALWAYNAGPGNIPRHGPVTPPPETRAYARQVMRAGM